jgi:hypothetical protein
MRVLDKLIRGCLTFGLAAALVGGIPQQAAAAKDLSTPLPNEPVLLSPVAVSGSHILVQAGNTFRLSHDGGKTWSASAFPCPLAAGCPTNPVDASTVGRIASGVMIMHTDSLSRLEAYSLATNTAVGIPYTIPNGSDVADLVGAFALLHDYLANTYTIHSLADGSDRGVTLPSTSSYPSLLDDGSLLVTQGSSWYRLRADGSLTKVYATTASGERHTSGKWASYTTTKVSKPLTTHCLINLDTATHSCRTSLGRYEHVVSMGSAGILTEIKGNARFYWYPFQNGKVGAARVVKFAIGKGGYYRQVSSEDGPVIVGNTTSPNSILMLLKSSGKVSYLKLSWAHVPVLPSSLALTKTSVLGWFDTDFNTFSWVRNASTSLGAQKRLSAVGAVAASGSRWAVSSTEKDRVRFYDGGRLTKVATGISESSNLILSGPHLLARPLCREAPLVTDDDCSVPASLRRVDGTRLSVPATTEDIFGELMVVRTGDGTIFSRTVKVSNYVDPTQASHTVQLPDPGTGGYLTDVRIWGDWIGATVRAASDGLGYPVVVNYHTGTTLTGAVKARLLALGDGVAVSVLPHSTTLQVWNLAHNTTQIVAATSKVVALNGSRLAYGTGKKLVIKNLTGVNLSAPRVLGVVAAKTWSRSWKLAIDVTKPTKSARLEISNHAGIVVRSLKVPASSTGSLRAIRWNARNSAGKRVPAGTYTYRLIAQAVDGSGSVGSVEGGSAAIGTVRVA